jgi:hypothetical protein
MKKPRTCRICNKTLSEYNPADVCFCHDEHPAKKDMPERDHEPPVGAGHDTPELNRLIMDEYGPWGFR